MVELSNRLKKLNHRVKTIDYYNPIPWYFDDINILDCSEYEWVKKEPIVIRKAYSIQYVAKNLPIRIYDDELIVGVPSQSSVEFGTTFPEYLSEKERKEFEQYDLNEYGLYAHHAPDWSRIINKGTRGLIADIEEALNKISKEDDEYEEKRDELRAMQISLEALELFAKRYVEEIDIIIQSTTNSDRKKELELMSSIVNNVPMNPASSLWEALQSFWLTYVLLSSNGEMLPLGRLDQHFGKFLRNDSINNGFTTDLIGSFLIKCNERNVIDATLLSEKRVVPLKKGRFRRNTHYYHDDEPETSENNKFFGQEANNRMMTAVVSGMLSDGSDGTNELSGLLLELQDKLDLLMPTFGVRIHKNTPRDFLEIVADLLRHGQGEPVIYNDDAIIDNHQRLMIDKEDVINFSSDGCWEVIFPGKDNFEYDNIYALQCVEWTLNQGRRVKTNEVDGLVTDELNKISSYEKFYKNFMRQIGFQLETRARNFAEQMGLVAITSPDPLLSTMCEGCIQNGKDFMGDGAKYQHRMLLLVGFADAVDSLAVIKKLVFEERDITLEELNEALYSNWKGFEWLREIVNKKVTKYGNNESYVDDIAVRFMEDYSKKLSEIRNKYSSIVFTGGIGTFHMYAAWGNDTSATPNGRGAYEPLAPNYSPVPGTNINGPLVTILSSTRGDLSNFMTGTPIDLQISEKDFKGESGLERLVDMIEGFCELGGQIMTISSYSVEQLKDAKNNPEKHKDLRVRMGGLSAYFVQLAPVAQDKIIERFTIC